MRALTVVGLLALAGCAGGAMFVDQLEDGRAVLIDEGGGVHRVPASLLPPDAGEGSWIGDPPLPDPRTRVATLRHKLAAHDDGRDLTLR